MAGSGIEESTKLVRSSGDGFAFGGEAVDLGTNELLEVPFALDEELHCQPG